MSKINLIPDVYGVLMMYEYVKRNTPISEKTKENVIKFSHEIMKNKNIVDEKFMKVKIKNEEEEEIKEKKKEISAEMEKYVLEMPRSGNNPRYFFGFHSFSRGREYFFEKTMRDIKGKLKRVFPEIDTTFITIGALDKVKIYLNVDRDLVIVIRQY